MEESESDDEGNCCVCELFTPVVVNLPSQNLLFCPQGAKIGSPSQSALPALLLLFFTICLFLEFSSMITQGVSTGLFDIGTPALNDPKDERYRPSYHYTPTRNFMNDPNGLTYRDGLFYAFHQYNPHGNVWGHMAWKQVTSPNLVDWHHMPPALEEEHGVMIYSGSAVVDREGTAGFGRGAFVAMYTGHRTSDHLEAQCLASSLNGRTWTKFRAGRPVRCHHSHSSVVTLFLGCLCCLKSNAHCASHDRYSYWNTNRTSETRSCFGTSPRTPGA